MSVNLAVGLGNSEARYALTRHNAGALALERLAKSCGVECMRFDKYANAYLAKGSIAGKPLAFAFAEGYMNESGRGLARILKRLKADISSVAVIYDDITIGVGRMKLSRGGSSGGHNGVADIMEFCGNSFVRVRIGVGAKADKRMDLADHVLGKLSEADLAAISALPVRECFSLLLSKGLEAAQNEINRRAEPRPRESGGGCGGA
ncbi:MAG: hypothetical protein BHW65_05350 [Verrucomicrobia bacterium CAG:312_58_20]|nr:MAG: hypothetical protein BHW65_05350 [Verrucomicrobia bacterium CAG:312_58_20]PWL63895.1 MAG: hypothetical protein DBY30_09895 [Verrucomicrobiota bacterium]